MALSLSLFLFSCGGGGGEDYGTGNSTGNYVVEEFKATPDGIVRDCSIHVGCISNFPDYQVSVITWSVTGAENETIEFCTAGGACEVVGSTGSKTVAPQQNTTYELRINGEVKGTVDVYVYDPDQLLIDLNVYSGHTERWLDGVIKVYDETNFPYLQETLDFFNSRLPDNVRLVTTTEPDLAEVIISFAPNATWDIGLSSCPHDPDAYYKNPPCDIWVKNSSVYVTDQLVIAHELAHILGFLSHTDTSGYPEEGGCFSPPSL